VANVKQKKDRESFHLQSATEIFDDIITSNLRPVEKLFLMLEWFLREKKPMDLLGLDLKEISEKADIFVDRRVPVNVRKSALEEAQEILHTRDDQDSFTALFGLSYYSYVNDEFLYSSSVRNELISKIAEIDISPFRIRRLYSKWEKIVGNSGELFNKIFQR
jgi:hypothetical protein